MFTMSSPNRPPATKEEVANEPAGHEQVTEETAVSEPAGHEPPTHELVTTEPAANKSPVHQPAVKETVANEPETNNENTIRIVRNLSLTSINVLILLQDDNDTDSAFDGDS